MNVVFHSYYFQSFATLSNFNIVEDGLYSGDTRDVLLVYHIFYVNSTMPTIIFDKIEILKSRQFYDLIDHVYLMEKDYLYILLMMFMEDTITVDHSKKGRYLLEKEEEVLHFIEMEMYILVNILEKKTPRGYRKEEAS